MIPKKAAKNLDFISLAVAVTLVSCSRDYIGRLAREGKILAEQIDKQWFVSRESLLGFFEQSALEDSVKKRILSLSRKNDLEVKDYYTKVTAEIYGRSKTASVGSFFMTGLVVVGGLLAGFFVHTQPAIFSSASNPSFAQVVAALKQVSSEAAVVAGTPRAMFSEAVVLESQEKIPMQGGVVLFPATTVADSQIVDNLFSDEVTVVITSTSTGFIRAKGSRTELPFVRIPETAI